MTLAKSKALKAGAGGGEGFLRQSPIPSCAPRSEVPPAPVVSIHAFPDSAPQPDVHMLDMPSEIMPVHTRERESHR